MESRIFISNSLENRDPYVHSKYKTVFEQYQRAEEYIFYFWIGVFKIFNRTVINNHVILNMIYFYVHIFNTL